MLQLQKRPLLHILQTSLIVTGLLLFATYSEGTSGKNFKFDVILLSTLLIFLTIISILTYNKKYFSNLAVVIPIVLIFSTVGFNIFLAPKEISSVNYPLKKEKEISLKEISKNDPHVKIRTKFHSLYSIRKYLQEKNIYLPTISPLNSMSFVASKVSKKNIFTYVLIDRTILEHINNLSAIQPIKLDMHGYTIFFYPDEKTSAYVLLKIDEQKNMWKLIPLHSTTALELKNDTAS